MINDKIDYGEVKIYGRIISSSWWGQMWCRNIENYSDIQNRLERGRTYLRQNTIKNLSISSNCAESLVQGHSKEPYKVTINIKTIEKSKYENILNTCENSIDNLESLMTGSFPKEYQQFFTNDEYGLFPKYYEIDYKCTCRDYETNMHMCKHIAATMYAIGNKLDADPLIFFKLRGIDLTEFSKKIIKKENEFVWDKINSVSNRKIKENDISTLFGVDYEDDNEEIDVNKILYLDDNKDIKVTKNTKETNQEIVSKKINEEMQDNKEKQVKKIDIIVEKIPELTINNNSYSLNNADSNEKRKEMSEIEKLLKEYNKNIEQIKEMDVLIKQTYYDNKKYLNALTFSITLGDKNKYLNYIKTLENFIDKSNIYKVKSALRYSCEYLNYTITDYNKLLKKIKEGKRVIEKRVIEKRKIKKAEEKRKSKDIENNSIYTQYTFDDSGLFKEIDNTLANIDITILEKARKDNVKNKEDTKILDKAISERKKRDEVIRKEKERLKNLQKTENKKWRKRYIKAGLFGALLGIFRGLKK